MLGSESGSAFFFSNGERERERVLIFASERVRYFEERANALVKSMNYHLIGISMCKGSEHFYNGITFN